MPNRLRLSFLSDGASGSDVYDRARHVGWVQPGSIGLCDLASETAAVAAADLADRELGRRVGDDRREAVPAPTASTLAITRIGQGDWVTDGRRSIARLYRPKGRSSLDGADATYAIEFPTDTNSAEPSRYESPRQAWRAAYLAVRRGLDTSTPEPTAPPATRR